jgi:hypothetical protein
VTSTVPDDDPAARASELVTSGQIYRWLGVRRQRGNTITSDYRFPRPWFISEDGLTRIWRRALVVAWFDANRPQRAAELDASEPGWRGNSPPAE